MYRQGLPAIWPDETARWAQSLSHTHIQTQFTMVITVSVIYLKGGQESSGGHR